MALGGGSALLYMLVPGGLLMLLLCLCLALGRARAHASHDASPLRAPLVPHDTMQHRVDAAMRDAEAGFLLCATCKFENFRRAAYCSLCGERLATASGPSQPTLTASSHVQQLRSRKRKEWTRKLDVQGKLFWFRASVNHNSTDVSPSPGVSVVFSTPPLAKEDGVEPVSPSSAIVKVNEAVRMELLSSEAANPAMLPTGALFTPSPERIQEILTLAAKDFPTKYAHFVASTAALIMPAEVVFLKLALHRDYMLEQSIDHMSCVQEKDIRSHLRIMFIDESGVDAGGVYREWFLLLNEMLLNPALALFQCCNKTEQTYYLNPSSAHSTVIGEEHLTYYFVAGRLVGRALLEGQMLGFHLALPLLKIILGIPVTFSDLEYLDPEAYRSMMWLREKDGVTDLGLDFSVTEKRGEEIVTVDLVLNGRDIPVTDENKHEYLDCRFRYLVFESVSTQLYAFLKGVYEVIPPELLMLLDPEEFDFLLCGSDEIDVDDWQANSVTSVDLNSSSVVRWFWELVREMPNEYRRRLLQFATGSSRVPLSGFAGLASYDGRLCPFSLNGVPTSASHYISSHACFNRLDLPLYTTKRELKAMLYATLKTDVLGFTTA